MTDIRAYLKSNSNVNFKGGLAIKYNEYGRYCTISYPGKFELAVSVDAEQIELLSFLDGVIEDAQNGHVLQATWENPNIKGMDVSMTKSTRLAIGYRILLTFLNVETTRDIWLNFPNVHHSFLSYLRNRSLSQLLLMQYKVAILTCHIKGYSLGDTQKIEAAFEQCGLHRHNSIFYVLFLLEQHSNKITFDDQDVFVLTVDNMEFETEEFLNQKSTYKYCLGHAHKSLSFIWKANRGGPQEMANELMTATKVAYTTIRPFKSRAYSENYARRAMTNMVTRIIHAHTKYESNVRIISTQNGYESTHVMLTEATKDFDPTFSALEKSVGFSEDHMLDYIDSKRVKAA